ncbi:MAG: sigma-54-dependent Fis family transcriptional regulator [Bdellovibrionaceae bacterium]|nr:sigma-54-dependent Fis family transcriptional regulator [Pseudobdellovibrionaceae bacterium]
MRDKILIVEDNAAFAESLRNSLRGNDFDIEFASSGSLAVQKHREANNNYSVVVLDYNLPDMTGVDVARRICRQNPNQEIIFMTADDRVETYKEMVGLGYTKRFAIKDQEPQVLAGIIKSGVESYNKLTRKFEGLPPSSSTIEKDLQSIGMVGRSKALHDIFKLVQKLKNTTSSILILGNTGAGKELLASALCSTPSRYFPLNCATYGNGSEQFLATQLFGHVKGAYTGADKDQIGVLERAHGGTVFLDEIHCMSVGAQKSLLRTIETKRVVRFGDTTAQGTLVDFKLICAGKPKIEELIADSDNEQFVKDLYYRVAEYVIRIPDLSERKEDIEPLVLHMIGKISEETKKKISIRGEAIRILEDYTWPGNARDLRNTLKQMAIETPDGEITRVDAQRFLNKKMKIEELEVGVSLNESVQSAEAETIKKALRLSTSIRRAAILLKMPKSTLCHKVKKYNIDPERYLVSAQGL